MPYVRLWSHSQKYCMFLAAALTVAMLPNVSHADSTPQVTEWTYNMSGSNVIQSWKQKVAEYGCVLSATPQNWVAVNSRTIYAGGAASSITLDEVQGFNIQPFSDYVCATAFYNISTCGGTCEARARNEKSRTLYCSSGSLQERNIGGSWMWACSGGSQSKVVAIDPGHGLTCSAKGMAVGAVGATDFPPSDPPPGKLREDILTVAIALEVERILPASGYKVVMTKRDVNSCPDFKTRQKIATASKAQAFVSIHINRQNTFLGFEVPFANGTSALYHPSRTDSRTLADQMAGAVSSNLGVNNRGSFARDDLAILSPKFIQMPAVLLETARLSGTDERILHARDSATKTAVGIKQALDAFIGN